MLSIVTFLVIPSRHPFDFLLHLVSTLQTGHLTKLGFQIGASMMTKTLTVLNNSQSKHPPLSWI